MSAINPMLLQKQLRDNNKDLQEYFKDIKQWGEDMKRKEEARKQQDDNKNDVPPPKNKIPKVKKPKDKVEESKKESPMPKVPKPYNFWEKFDAEAECESIDKEESDSELSDEEDVAIMELAEEEKEKGNKFVKNGRYEDAIKCYTKAIDCFSYNPIFYANRALCHLKLKEYKAAEVDCTTALQIDNEYVKALYRRALAREALEQNENVIDDLMKALKLEPENKECKKLLEKVKKKVGTNMDQPTSSQRPKSKFTISRENATSAKNQVKIEEVEKETTCPAIKPNVYERINPLDKQLQTEQTQIPNKYEAQLSTSKAKVIDKQSEINWPSGNDVKIVCSVSKTPKQRTKLPLKRVQIFDVDIKHTYKLEAKPASIVSNPQPSPQNLNQNKISMDDFKIVERKQVENTEKVDIFEGLDCSVDVSNVDFNELNIPPPTTSVQFYQNWKHLDNRKRFLYLRQINPIQYTAIFKDSLETKVFSEIISTLGNAFVEENVPVFEYLYGLTMVKRFGALVMFKTSKDKAELLKLIDAMREDDRHSKEEVDYLIKKYEM